MRAVEYKKLDAAETEMWWFRSLHKFIFKLLPPAEGPQILDIGCGTGGLLSKFAQEGFSPTGVDYSAHGLEYAKKKVPNLARGSANALPFATFFDRVTCVDVLEVSTIDPDALVRNAIRVLKPGGFGVFVMAAHQWLLSEHDRAVDSVRRYDRKQMTALFARHNIEIIRSTYLFFSMFPFLALRKLLNKTGAHEEPESDVSTPPGVINQILYFVCSIEALFLPWVNLPMGSSVAIVVRKRG